ncbi:MAG TPA: cupredoxin domain-containing protein [Candidatus Cybelea sp.]|jgi:plastocyanin
MTLKQLVLLAGLTLAVPAAAPVARTLQPAHVTIHDHRFVPRVIHVKVGQEIVWLNTDQDPHTVTSGNGGTGDDVWKSSPLLPDGKTFTLHLYLPGTYQYFCKPHQFEESMHGTIVVSR